MEETISNYTNISEIAFNFLPETFAPIESAKSKRNALLKELYVLYTSQLEINRKENRKRYHEYVRLHYPSVCKKAGFNKANYDSYKDSFRKAKLSAEKRYLSYIKENSFSWWGKFAHLKGEEGNRALEHMISVAKDRQWRKQNVAIYILGSLKFQPVDNSLA